MASHRTINIGYGFSCNKIKGFGKFSGSDSLILGTSTMLIFMSLVPHVGFVVDDPRMSDFLRELGFRASKVVTTRRQFYVFMRKRSYWGMSFSL